MACCAAVVVTIAVLAGAAVNTGPLVLLDLEPAQHPIQTQIVTHIIRQTIPPTMPPIIAATAPK